MNFISEIDLIKNFKTSNCNLIRSYKFGKSNYKVVQVELFGDNDDYIRFSVDIEVDNTTSKAKIVSRFISVATGKAVPKLVTIDNQDLILNLIKNIQGDINDDQITTNQ